MNYKKLFRPCRMLGFLIMSLAVFPVSGMAQQSTQHVTLFGWEQRIRLFMLDRSHNFDGTHFNRGLFRENIRLLTPEHELDLMTYRFNLMDDYEWQLTENGFKTLMGSLNATDFATESYLKATHEFGDNHTVMIDGIQEENFRTSRFMVNLGYEYSFSGNHSVGFSHTVNKEKGDLDLSAYYRYGSFSNGMIKVGATLLDWGFNVTQRLARESENEYNDYEFTAQYQKKPELFSVELVSPQAGNFRGELMAGLQTHLRKTVTPEDTLRFIDDEWAHYLGGLVEFQNHFITTGITYQRTFSKLMREPEPGSDYDPTFGNWQISNRYGFFAVSGITKNIRLEHWIWYEYNTDRLQGPVIPQDLRAFDYVEKRVKIKSRAFYDPSEKGLRTGIEFHADYRYPQGEKGNNRVRNRDYRLVYQNVRNVNERMTFTIGYRFSPNFYVVGGISYDLDMDKISGFGVPRITGESTWFDGGFGRMYISW